MALTEQRNLSMSPDHWDALEAVAEQTGSRAMRGPARMAVSWRVLIKRIALGEFELVERQPYVMPERVVEAARQVEQQQRKQMQMQMPLGPA